VDLGYHLLEIKKFLIENHPDIDPAIGENVFFHLDKIEELTLSYEIENVNLYDQIDQLEERVWDLENELGVDDDATSN
jgi:polyhydroxyalkanoate synthesis regulator phasin